MNPLHVRRSKSLEGAAARSREHGAPDDGFACRTSHRSIRARATGRNVCGWRMRRPKTGLTVDDGDHRWIGEGAGCFLARYFGPIDAPGLPTALGGHTNPSSPGLSRVWLSTVLGDACRIRIEVGLPKSQRRARGRDQMRCSPVTTIGRRRAWSGPEAPKPGAAAHRRRS
jgi:hypothetical protein